MDKRNAEPTPNAERFWLKKQRANRERVNTMSTLSRIQVLFHTVAGESVTTTQLEFDERKNEYMTTASIAFLIGFTEADVWGILNSNGLIMREKNGQRWVAVKDAMFVLGLHYQ